MMTEDNILEMIFIQQTKVKINDCIVCLDNVKLYYVEIDGKRDHILILMECLSEQDYEYIKSNYVNWWSQLDISVIEFKYTEYKESKYFHAIIKKPGITIKNYIDTSGRMPYKSGVFVFEKMIEFGDKAINNNKWFVMHPSTIFLEEDSEQPRVFPLLLDLFLNSEERTSAFKALTGFCDMRNEKYIVCSICRIMYVLLSSINIFNVKKDISILLIWD